MRDALQIVAVAAALAGLGVRGASAQSCDTNGGAAVTVLACNAIVQDLTILQPRLGIVLTGGNPVAGASSTLGMRIGSVPRMTLAGRFTMGSADVRDAERISAINIDAGIGIFSGLTIMPTLGGFGSIDAVASAGKAFLADRVSSEDPMSWAVGVRLGVLRESFTAPGISITGMYRRIGDVEYSLLPPGGSAEIYSLTDNSVWSVRGVIGKRLFVLGAAAGVGYDSYESNIDVERQGLLGGAAATFAADGYTTDRWTVFANVSWTMLILHLVAEGGWQQGGDRFAAPLPDASAAGRSEKSGYYGSVAIRLAL